MFLKFKRLGCKPSLFCFERYITHTLFLLRYCALGPLSLPFYYQLITLVMLAFLKNIATTAFVDECGYIFSHAYQS